MNASLILVTALTTGILAQSERTVPGAPEPPTGQSAVNHDRQGSLAAARQLYASADYQGALDLLDRLAAASPSLQDLQSIDLYRTLCFVALGKTGEADAVIYDSNDQDVVAPISLKQDMPRFPRSVLVERTGVLFIVIGETGGVESAIITEPLDLAHDRMLLAATKTWTYRPATRIGSP